MPSRWYAKRLGCMSQASAAWQAEVGCSDVTAFCSFRALNVPVKLLDALDMHKLVHNTEPLLIQLSTDQACYCSLHGQQTGN